MSTTIKFEHEAQVKEETYNLGDWFMFQGELYHLCASPALNEMPQSLFIRASRGSRLDVFSPESGGHDVYSYDDICRGFQSKDWQRVSVEITTKPFQP